MNRLTFVLISAVLLSCSTSQKRNEINESTNDIDFEIGTFGVIDLGQFKYFQEMEKLLIEEHKVSPEEVEDYIQISIDEQILPEPYIVVETDSGLKVKTVTYNHYKRYRAEHPIDSNREMTVNIKLEPKVDYPKFDSVTLKSLLGTEVN